MMIIIIIIIIISIIIIIIIISRTLNALTWLLSLNKGNICVNIHKSLYLLLLLLALLLLSSSLSLSLSLLWNQQCFLTSKSIQAFKNKYITGVLDGTFCCYTSTQTRVNTILVGRGNNEANN